MLKMRGLINNQLAENNRVRAEYLAEKADREAQGYSPEF
jgi:hypothetical protein